MRSQYRLILFFTMAVFVSEGSIIATPTKEHTYSSLRRHSDMVRRSTIGKMRNVPTRNVIMANQRRYKRQYYPAYPGYYNPVYSGSYYYPAYPGFYNPIGSGSLWAAGGGLVGNTLSFLLGKK